MKAVWKINKTALLAMTLAALAVALTASAAWAQGISPVVWNKNSFTYDDGQAPSVAVSGSVIVEVHEGTPGSLWSHTGTIQENGTVTWATGAFQYDNGYAPSIAISGNNVIEVHQAGSGEGALWYRTGTITSTGTVNWAATSS